MDDIELNSDQELMQYLLDAISGGSKTRILFSSTQQGKIKSDLDVASALEAAEAKGYTVLIAPVKKEEDGYRIFGHKSGLTGVVRFFNGVYV